MNPKYHWYSDWNGYEVGYPEIDAVGLYRIDENTCAYINCETGEIIESWTDDDEEEF